jgi:hypothetical protein
MELPIFNTYMNFFSPSFLLLSQLFLCLFWISLWPRIGVYNTRDQYWVNGLKFTPVHIVRALSFLFFSFLFYNTLSSKICVKLLKPPKIQMPTPNTSFRIR